MLTGCSFSCTLIDTGLAVPPFLYVFFFAIWVWRTKGWFILVANETAYHAKLEGTEKQPVDTDYEANLGDDKKVESEQIEMVDNVRY